MVRSVEPELEFKKGYLPTFSDKVFDLRMKESTESLNYIFNALKNLNKCKDYLLSQNEISYEQYLNSFKHAQPTPKSELMHNNIIEIDSSSEMI